MARPSDDPLGSVAAINEHASLSRLGAYSSARAAEIKNRTFDRGALTARPLPYERLDQLVVELLMGVR